MKTQKIVIADANCLIILDKINELTILEKLFGKILTTELVAKEFGLTLPNWILVESNSPLSQSSFTLDVLDIGEISVIALALQYKDCILILDDLKARQQAKRLGLTITGTIGILVEAKMVGIIPSIKPILNKIRKTNFRLASSFYDMILKSVGE